MNIKKVWALLAKYLANRRLATGNRGNTPEKEGLCKPWSPCITNVTHNKWLLWCKNISKFGRQRSLHLKSSYILRGLSTTGQVDDYFNIIGGVLTSRCPPPKEKILQALLILPMVVWSWSVIRVFTLLSTVATLKWKQELTVMALCSLLGNVSSSTLETHRALNPGNEDNHWIALHIIHSP